jgi:hypothetical protein
MEPIDEPKLDAVRDLLSQVSRASFVLAPLLTGPDQPDKDVVAAVAELDQLVSFVVGHAFDEDVGDATLTDEIDRRLRLVGGLLEAAERRETTDPATTRRLAEVSSLLRALQPVMSTVTEGGEHR